jgi:Flp pilus assembly protein TadG
MKQLIRRLAADTGGSAAMEFAFVAPVFIFMTTGAIDLGYIQLGRAQLQGATQHAARTIIQSKSGTTAQRKAVVEGQITARMGPFKLPTGTTMTVSVKKFSNYAGLNPEPFTDTNANGRWDAGEPYTDVNANSQWDNDSGTADDLGGVGDVVKIDVLYPLRPLFSYNAALFGNNGSLTLKATAVFRNEPD